MDSQSVCHPLFHSERGLEILCPKSASFRTSSSHVLFVQTAFVCTTETSLFSILCTATRNGTVHWLQDTVQSRECLLFHLGHEGMGTLDASVVADVEDAFVALLVLSCLEQIFVVEFVLFFFVCVDKMNKWNEQIQELKASSSSSTLPSISDSILQYPFRISNVESKSDHVCLTFQAMEESNIHTICLKQKFCPLANLHITLAEDGVKWHWQTFQTKVEAPVEDEEEEEEEQYVPVLSRSLTDWNALFGIEHIQCITPDQELFSFFYENTNCPRGSHLVQILFRNGKYVMCVLNK